MSKGANNVIYHSLNNVSKRRVNSSARSDVQYLKAILSERERERERESVCVCVCVSARACVYLSVCKHTRDILSLSVTSITSIFLTNNSM
jgi:hypothetical protein